MLWPHQEWEQSLFFSAALESLLYLQSFLHFNCGGLEVGWGLSGGAGAGWGDVASPGVGLSPSSG